MKQDIFDSNSFSPDVDILGTALTEPPAIDTDQINTEARSEANKMIADLSNMYFSKEYIDKHPYLPAKIESQVDTMRRLIKMLEADEQAQDILIQSITATTLSDKNLRCLTDIQRTMLEIQGKIDEILNEYQKMLKELQSNTLFDNGDSNVVTEDGTAAPSGTLIRGSKEYISLMRHKFESTGGAAGAPPAETCQ